MRFSLFVAAFGLIGLAQATVDETDPYSRYSDQTEYDASLAVPWIEREIQVEALPEETDLTAFPMDKMPSNMRLYGDLAHIKIGAEDGVTRLWLVAKSTQGAYNGTYEGFRCATKEYKVYAYGNPDRREPLRHVQLPRWRPVKRNKYRHELMHDFLCHNLHPRQPHEVAEQLHKNPMQYDPSY